MNTINSLIRKLREHSKNPSARDVHKHNNICIISMWTYIASIAVVLTAHYKFISPSDIQQSIFSMIGILILVVLHSASSASSDHSSRQSILFRRTVFDLASTFMVYSLTMIFSSVPGSKTAVTIYHTLIFIILAMTMFRFTSYHIEYFSVSEKTKKLINRINLISFVIYISAIILNPFTDFFFIVSDDSSISYPDTYYLADAYYVVWIITIIVFVIISDNAARTKIALLSYGLLSVFIPFIDAGSSNTISNDWIILYSCLLSVFTIFCLIHTEQNKKLLGEKAENASAQAAVTLTRMQPDFLYDCLDSIAQLCRNDPSKAETAVKNFTDFLRNNIDTLKSKKSVFFDRELAHTEKYLWLEQIISVSKIKAEYNIQYKDFRIPPAVLQPLVEFAVRHSLLLTEDGGTVTVSSELCSSGIIITVSNNCQGTIIDAPSEIAFRNIRERLKASCGGTLTIENCPDTGTKATVIIPERK